MEQNEKRYIILRAVYEHTNCSTSEQFYTIDVFKRLGQFEQGEIEQILNYFADKGYLKKGNFEWGANEEGRNYFLTSDGIDAYENWQNTFANALEELRKILESLRNELQKSNQANTELAQIIKEIKEDGNISETKNKIFNVVQTGAALAQLLDFFSKIFSHG
ncbi:MAG: hypothetical protein ACRCYY_16625 [Trueperaceae bacterium]